MRATAVSASGAANVNTDHELSVKAQKALGVEKSNCVLLRQAIANVPTLNIKKHSDKGTTELYMLWVLYFLLFTLPISDS